MNSRFKFSVTLCAYLLSIACAVNEDAHLGNLLNAVKYALYDAASLDNLSRRPQDLYYSHSNGLSLGVYEALLSITRNDDLECLPRLLCEAAAGGKPGFSGRDVKFDKDSLTKFVSYLNLGPSPLLTFAKAALLGASNRGDPYSCIINYAKCPKDQSRLLHYLNNHRGGFFQYFDKKEYKPGDNRPQNQYQYRPGYNYYSNSPVKYTKNKIKFDNAVNFIGNLKKKLADSGTYAKKYGYSSKFKFPNLLNRYPKRENYNYNRHRDGSDRDGDGHNKPMVFPEEAINPRILNEPVSPSKNPNENFFHGSNRFPEKVATTLSFFPAKDDDDENENRESKGIAFDRLPAQFHDFDFPSFEFPRREKSFFPTS